MVLFLIALVLYAGVNLHEKLIKDHTMPQIHMSKDSIRVSVNADEKEILKGITASDKKDGDITDSLTVENMSNFIKKGRRNVTITAADSDNHVSKVTRKLNYKDYVAPKYKLTAPLRFPINETEENIMSVISVRDVLDGDLTRNITASVEKKMSIDTAGDYDITFTVMNSAGDVAELPVTLTLYDPQTENGAPTIELSKYLINVVKDGEITPWDYVRAVQMDGHRYERAEDGALYEKGSDNDASSISQGNVRIISDVDMGKIGTYEITYKVRDSEGRSGSVRLVVCVR